MQSFWWTDAPFWVQPMCLNMMHFEPWDGLVSQRWIAYPALLPKFTLLQSAHFDPRRSLYYGWYSPDWYVGYDGTTTILPFKHWAQYLYLGANCSIPTRPSPGEEIIGSTRWGWDINSGCGDTTTSHQLTGQTDVSSHGRSLLLALFLSAAIWLWLLLHPPLNLLCFPHRRLAKQVELLKSLS
jgi:hypothetical protein